MDGHRGPRRAVCSRKADVVIDDAYAAAAGELRRAEERFPWSELAGEGTQKGSWRG